MLNRLTTQFLIVTVFVLLVLIPLSAQADVRARLDRNKIYEGDTFTLIIESSGRQTGQPDLSPLKKDFRLLGSSTSSQVSIVNGRRSDKKSWNVQLEPRQIGKLQIPPLQVGRERTRAIIFTVEKAPDAILSGQSQHLFIEVETDRSGPIYVQQQITYRVRFYYDSQIMSGDLKDPQAKNAVIEKLGEDKRYQVEHKGRTYRVIESHYAISAEKSGELLISPVIFKGRMQSVQRAKAPRPRQRSLIDRFFNNSPFDNDPFFRGDSSTDPGNPISVRSKEITITVKPRPAAVGDTWLPAEQFVLKDSWVDKPPQWRVGEPVTRTITLRAVGLTGTQLPALTIQEPGQIRLYAETPVNETQTDGNKVYGISKQHFTYIPAQPGKQIIPSIEINWWDTDSDQQKTARLPKWEISIEPGASVPQSSLSEVTKSHNDAEPTESFIAEKHPNEVTVDRINSSTPWLITAGVLLILTLLALISKWPGRAKTAPVTGDEKGSTKPKTKTLIRTHMQQLEDACNANDAEAAARSILSLGEIRWPDDPPRNLQSLASRLQQGQKQIMALERALYANEGQTWEGAGLAQAIKTTWKKEKPKKKSTDKVIPSLYPNDD